MGLHLMLFQMAHGKLMQGVYCAATPERIVSAKRFMGKLEKVHKVRHEHGAAEY